MVDHGKAFFLNTEYNMNFMRTTIHKINVDQNNVFVKRDDLLPFSFGGNKARKAQYFLEDIKEKKADYLVTYGSASSNHCRVIANLASSLDIPCLVISPDKEEYETINRKLIKFFNAEIFFCPVSEVSKTIDDNMKRLSNEGYNPYFIMGGGHGNLGTRAYVDCFEEILEYEKETNIKFDYIFHASGTGTTQSGLICGKLMNNSDVHIVGISISRRCPYGRNVVMNSIVDYLGDKYSLELYEKSLDFIDDYVLDGYGCANDEILKIISDQMRINGMPLNKTYTGKAFWGMTEYIKKNDIKHKNILFINTGGAPLFFDDLGNL